MSVHQHHVFAPDLESVARARHFVASALPDAVARVDADLVDVAQLLTSELVSNAVLHAGTAFEVAVELEDYDDGLAVVISVCDHSSRLPVLRAPDADVPGGRGIFLVDQLAAGWGVEPRGAGKRVWCRLVATPARLAPRVRSLGGV